MLSSKATVSVIMGLTSILLLDNKLIALDGYCFVKCANFVSTFDGIIEKSIHLIKKNVNDFENIEVFIGPSISKKNYEVQKEFIGYFGSDFIEKIDNKLFCNLKGIAKYQLRKFGLKNIIDVNQCTYENINYHSFRRDKTSKRMIGLIYYE